MIDRCWMKSAVLLAAMLSIGCATAVAEKPGVVSAEKTLRYLASDELGGRGVDQPGLDSAADYIAGEFKAMGLKPIGADYFQAFDFTLRTTTDPSTTLAVNGEPLELDKAYRPLGISADSRIDSTVVFAGYGITNEKDGYDDYTGVDVKGKAVLVFRFEPKDAAGLSVFSKSKGWSEHATFVSKTKTAQAHGAAALLLVDPGSKGLLPFPAGGSEGITIPVVNLTRESADAILKQAGMADSAALKAKIDAAVKPDSIAMADTKVVGDVKLVRKVAKVKNVIGVLPGEGPTAGEYVVVGSHYDHLGTSKTKKPEIFHGADDNASGTTAMLEIARRVSLLGPQKRSIVFVAFTAEEQGLVGSNEFVSKPTVPLEKIVAMVNLDMVGRVRDETLYTGGSRTAAAFKDILKTADEHSPLVLKSMGDGGRGPSDHLSFSLKKIPVLFLYSGLHPDYHRPTDTVDKINFAGIEDTADLAADIVRQVSAMPRQTYDDSADGKDPNVSIGFAGDGRGKRVTLGVVPDYNSGDTVAGVRITDTSPDTPAAEAGLKGGDVIVKLGVTDIESLQGLSAALGTAEPYKPTTVVVMRDGKRVELPVTLVEKE